MPDNAGQVNLVISGNRECPWGTLLYIPPYVLLGTVGLPVPGTNTVYLPR